MARAVLRLHCLGGDEDIDGVMSGGHRMSPRGALHRRQPQSGKRKSEVPHAKFGIDQDVERISPYAGRCLRRSPPRHGSEMIRTRSQAFGQHIAHRQQVIHEDLEVLARQPGDPLLEVAARRAIAEEGRREADPYP